MINLINYTKIYKNRSLSAILKKTASKILKDFNKTGLEINIVICDNNFIRNLNRDFRKIDSPTDVLSFCQMEGENLDDKDSGSLGDIIVSIEKAVEQSRTFGINVEEELARLVVHGTLHLLGFDHEKSRQAEEEMLSLQDNYVDFFKVLSE